MALYISHSIFHLARVCMSGRKLFDPTTYVCNKQNSYNKSKPYFHDGHDSNFRRYPQYFSGVKCEHSYVYKACVALPPNCRIPQGNLCLIYINQ